MTPKRTVDLGAVRVARARLKALVRENPELGGPRGTKNVAGWMKILEEEDQAMADTEQVAFRLARDLVKQLDVYAQEMSKAQPGMTFTRTDVVRILLTRALEEGAKTTAKAPRGRQPKVR